MYDVIIVGAGVVGSAIAWQLSRYDLSVLVLERETDLCEGTSKANSGIAHAGFDAMPGTLKAKLNVRGNQMIHELSDTLGFAFKENGAFVLCFDEADHGGLDELYNRGIANGVEGLSIISGDEARQLEPSISETVVAALYAKTSGIVCPFEMTIAFAEVANVNGALFVFDTEVTDITSMGSGANDDNSGFVVSTSKGDYESRIVINAAGVYADTIHNMVSGTEMKITPRRGEYHLLDKEVGETVTRTIFQLPTKLGKGVLVTPTVHGNLLVGPSADNLEDKEDTATTSDVLASLKEKSALSVPGIPFNKAITSFSGLRAVGETGDFIIEESDVPGFIDVAGIESPGLTSAPAIGEYVKDIVQGIFAREDARENGSDSCEYKLPEKEDYIETRKGLVHFASLTMEQQNEMIKSDSSYGKIVCRCESVTEGEIRDAIKRPLGATTLDGVKRRTRAGMGRCQAGFCSPKVMAILSEELNIPLDSISKN
ncbi:glycerol-3-phosphate dehydrogenase [Lachnospiraceae bacterium NE2001]|nr:glycerol-3-phosphate dehydrogenase [Lachnospiraceae bacterium NE2001]